jgi:hypothetical protein
MNSIRTGLVMLGMVAMVASTSAPASAAEIPSQPTAAAVVRSNLPILVPGKGVAHPNTEPNGQLVYRFEGGRGAVVTQADYSAMVAAGARTPVRQVVAKKWRDLKATASAWSARRAATRRVPTPRPTVPPPQIKHR